MRAVVVWYAALGMGLLVGSYAANRAAVPQPTLQAAPNHAAPNHAAPNADAGMTPDSGTSGAGYPSD